MNNLSKALEDWTDIEGAEHELAICLGLYPLDTAYTKVKGIYWSNNPVGNALAKILDELVAAGILEKRDEPDFQYRWNAKFNALDRYKS